MWSTCNVHVMSSTHAEPTLELSQRLLMVHKLMSSIWNHLGWAELNKESSANSFGLPHQRESCFEDAGTYHWKPWIGTHLWYWETSFYKQDAAFLRCWPEETVEPPKCGHLEIRTSCLIRTLCFCPNAIELGTYVCVISPLKSGCLSDQDTLSRSPKVSFHLWNQIRTLILGLQKCYCTSEIRSGHSFYVGLQKCHFTSEIRTPLWSGHSF